MYWAWAGAECFVGYQGMLIVFLVAVLGPYLQLSGWHGSGARAWVGPQGFVGYKGMGYRGMLIEFFVSVLAPNLQLSGRQGWRIRYCQVLCWKNDVSLSFWCTFYLSIFSSWTRAYDQIEMPIDKIDTVSNSIHVYSILDVAIILYFNKYFITI